VTVPGLDTIDRCGARPAGGTGVRLRGHVCRREHARARVGADELSDGLALRRREGIHVDQCLDLRIAGGGVGDNGAAVGMPDQDDGSGNGVQEVAVAARATARSFARLMVRAIFTVSSPLFLLARCSHRAGTARSARASRV
jgi:hypothetical protein